VTPIRELDGRVIGAGKAGPITKKIQTHFSPSSPARTRNGAHG